MTHIERAFNLIESIPIHGISAKLIERTTKQFYNNLADGKGFEHM